MLITHGGFEEALRIRRTIANFETVHSFLSVTFNWYVTLNQYCLLLLSIKDFANFRFSIFAYWCEIKGIQLLLFELGCVVWQKHTFWMLRHRQTLYPCDGWPVLYCVFMMTYFIFVFSSYSPCKFKPTQFSHFSGWIWMSWGKEMTTMKLRLAKPLFSWLIISQTQEWSCLL